MSRLARKPIKIEEGIILKKEGGFVTVKGPKGEIRVTIQPAVDVAIENGGVMLRAKTTEDRNPHLGTAHALLKNALEGVKTGFSKFLEIEGIGYRVVVEGKELVLFLGYAQPVRVVIPEGLVLKVEKSTMEITGINKELVGQFAAQIRAFKKPEPYKGKGIRYRGEVIKRKVGKKAGATATT